MSLSIDKFTSTCCDELKNSTFILKHNVNVEQTSRASSSASSQEQPIVVKTRHKGTRKRHHHEIYSLEDSDDSDDNNFPIHKSPRVNSHHSCVQSSTARRDDDKASIPDEEKMNRD